MFGPIATSRPPGFRQRKGLVEGHAQGVLIRQVLKKVAGENEVELARLHLPRLRTILLQKSDFRLQARPGIRIEVHGQFLPGADVVDEFAVAAAQVKDGAGFGRELLEKSGHQDLPHAAAIGARFSETSRVYFGQFLLVLALIVFDGNRRS